MTVPTRRTGTAARVFLPIGYEGTPFTGTFNGGGYNIDGLTEIRADDDVDTDFYSNPATNQEYIGLFGETDGAAITDTHLTSAMIKGYMYVGGITGYMNGGTLSNSSVNTNISQPDGDCDTTRTVSGRDTVGTAVA
ncbi:MAG: hypothetical protein WDN27_05090 [Candidatus Saccharibacteria bacterium]